MDRKIVLTSKMATITLNCAQRDDIDESLTYYVFRDSDGPVMLEERHAVTLKNRLTQVCDNVIRKYILELENNLDDGEYND